eukprot:15439049-Alexandrium_andersonii.AAC.1
MGKIPPGRLVIFERCLDLQKVQHDYICFGSDIDDRGELDLPRHWVGRHCLGCLGGRSLPTAPALSRRRGGLSVSAASRRADRLFTPGEVAQHAAREAEPTEF